MPSILEKPTVRKAYLLLEDGSFFEGRSIGMEGTTSGEICFNTAMTGYQEVFTDPSYYGQVLVETNVHVGNYGTTASDMESESVRIKGLVCRNFANKHSRQMADSSLQDFFIKERLVGICDVDTRAIVRHIRSKGAMNSVISTEISDREMLMDVIRDTPSMEGQECASKVTRNCQEDWGDVNAKYKVAVLDYGVKNSILKNFLERDCQLRIFPASTQYEEIMEWNPDGYFLSNGPGDPMSMSYAMSTVDSIVNSGKPTFGICLGHQLLCLSLGLETYKMHHGHRGSNHAVKNLITGKCEITSQNHGFGVDLDSAKASSDVVITHINLNDDTLEGIALVGKPVFSIQYHPEASPGPHDSRYLFDDFIDLLQS